MGISCSASFFTGPTSRYYIRYYSLWSYLQDDEGNSSGYQTVMRLLENGEKISHMFRCARVQGLDTAEGLLLFGREHFYILDGFTLVSA